MSDFLTNVLAHIAEGVKSFREDRADNPDMSDAEFVLATGEAAGAETEKRNAARNAALIATAAIYRIIQLEDALRDMAERNHSMHAHNTEFTIDECRRDECFNALDLLGDHA